MINRSRIEAPYGNVDHVDEIGAKRSADNNIEKQIAFLEKRSRLLRERSIKELDKHSQASIERTMELFRNGFDPLAGNGQTGNNIDKNDEPLGKSR